MNINRMTDEELAGKIQYFDFPIICDWAELPKPEQNRYLTLARFLRQCVRDSRKELVETLRNKMTKWNCSYGKITELTENDCGYDFEQNCTQLILERPENGKDSDGN